MAGDLSVEWGGSLNAMAARVESYKQNLLRAVFALATEWAARIEAAMKSGARWQDQTGLARRTLFGRVFRLATGALLIAGGQAFYQIFLERKHAGKNAIIVPTLQQSYGPIMASLAALVR